MKSNVFILTLLVLLSWDRSVGQKSEAGIIEGRIYNKANNQPVEFANLIIYGTTIGALIEELR